MGNFTGSKRLLSLRNTALGFLIGAVFFLSHGVFCQGRFLMATEIAEKLWDHFAVPYDPKENGRSISLDPTKFRRLLKDRVTFSMSPTEKIFADKLVFKLNYQCTPGFADRDIDADAEDCVGKPECLRLRPDGKYEYEGYIFFHYFCNPKNSPIISFDAMYDAVHNEASDENQSMLPKIKEHYYIQKTEIVDFVEVKKIVKAELLMFPGFSLFFSEKSTENYFREVMSKAVKTFDFVCELASSATILFERTVVIRFADCAAFFYSAERETLKRIRAPWRFGNMSLEAEGPLRYLYGSTNKKIAYCGLRPRGRNMGGILSDNKLCDISNFLQQVPVYHVLDYGEDYPPREPKPEIPADNGLTSYDEFINNNTKKWRSGSNKGRLEMDTTKKTMFIVLIVLLGISLLTAAIFAIRERVNRFRKTQETYM